MVVAAREQQVWRDAAVAARRIARHARFVPSGYVAIFMPITFGLEPLTSARARKRGRKEDYVAWWVSDSEAAQ